jgi:PAS domain S-box-containing protein
VAEQTTEVREDKTFLEQLIAASPSVIWRADAHDMRVTYVSPNVERVLGYAPSELLGTRGWTALVPPEDYERFRSETAAASQQGKAQSESEHRFVHKDGTYRWMYTLTRFERNTAGKTTSILGFSQDITPRKVAEETVEQARLEAERASLAKNEFLSRMSHELRTPLNAVLGFAQLLEMDPLTSEQHESLSYILKAGRHLLDLINEVLDIARIEAGRLGISPEPVPVAEVTQEALALTAPLAADRDIRLRSEIFETVGSHVLADRQRLKQVLLNLLSNAVKYNRRGGEVVLSEEALPGRLRIRVTDTGPGIALEKQSRLFIPFERLGTVKGGVEGTGLGLALSKGLTEAMGGSIGVTSRVGEGSTFWIDLPVADAPAERVERMEDEGLLVPGGAPAEKISTVLYIEDNLSNFELIERVLARRPGVKLMSAMQGRIGLALAREHQPDLILLDLHLPDIPGDEVLRRLQTDLRTRLIPVVAISADPTPGQSERLLAAGAHACLTKPVDVRELIRLVDATLKLRIG